MSRTELRDRGFARRVEDVPAVETLRGSDGFRVIAHPLAASAFVWDKRAFGHPSSVWISSRCSSSAVACAVVTRSAVGARDD